MFESKTSWSLLGALGDCGCVGCVLGASWVSSGCVLGASWASFRGVRLRWCIFRGLHRLRTPYSSPRYPCGLGPGLARGESSLEEYRSQYRNWDGLSPCTLCVQLFAYCGCICAPSTFASALWLPLRPSCKPSRRLTLVCGMSKKHKI